MANAFSNTGSGVGNSTPAYPQSKNPIQMSTVPQQIFTPSTPVKSITSPSGSTTTFHAPTTGTTSGAIKSSTPAPSNGSIVDYLNGQGKASDYNTRAGLAQQYGISGYTGTAEQNTQLLGKLQSGGQPTQSVGTTAGILNQPAPVNQQVQASQVNPITGVNQNNSITSGQYTPPNQGTQGVSQGGVIGNLITQAQTNSPEYNAQIEEANRIAAERTNLQREFAQKSNNINQTAGFLTQAGGEQALLQNQYNQGNAALSAQEQAITNQLNAINTRQGQQITANASAGQLNAPVLTTPTQTPFSPSSNSFVGGLSQMDRAVQGANISSVQDLTTQKNQIQSVFNGAEANFKLLVDTARQGGVNDTNIPAINAIQQAVGRGLASSSAVINFQNTLATVRSQYAQILGGGTATVDSQNRAEQAIPPTISLGALQSLEQQLKAEATNRIAGIDNQIKTISSGSQTPLKTGTTSGSNANLTWDNL